LLLEQGAVDRRRWWNRRIRLQGALIVAVVFAVGVTFSALGSPLWVAVLYLVLGVALAVLRLRAGGPAPDGRRAIGYVHGRSRERTTAVRRFCETRGLYLTSLEHDSGPERRSLARALAQLEAGQADVLVVGRLQDLSEDVGSLGPLLKWFDGGQRTLIAVDVDLDTSTEAGRLAVAAVAGLVRRAAEPEPVAQIAQIAPQGRSAVADVPELKARIVAMRERGMTLQAIADALNAEGVPTLRGGVLWRPSSVQRATGYRRPGRGIEVDP
jgi:DNA invertase Pin-like site-specific DNA recombinase